MSHKSHHHTIVTPFDPGSLLSLRVCALLRCWRAPIGQTEERLARRLPWFEASR